MKRKIIKLGNATLVTSLPSKWAKKLNLKAGDEIEIREENDSIILNPKGFAPKTEKIELDLKGNLPRRTVRRYMGSSYKKGYDEIKVFYDNETVIKTIEGIVPDLLGYEIIEQKEGMCIISNVASPNVEEFDKMLRRTFLILLSTSQDSLKAIKEEDTDYLKQVERLDKNVNKFTDFAKRLLVKNRAKGKESHYYYIISAYLELIGNELKYLAEQASGKKINKKTIEYYSAITEYFREFYELFYKYDHEKEKKFTGKRDKLVKQGYLLMNKKETDKIIINHLITLTILTYQMSGSLFGIHLL